MKRRRRSALLETGSVSAAFALCLWIGDGVITIPMLSVYHQHHTGEKESALSWKGVNGHNACRLRNVGFSSKH